MTPALLAAIAERIDDAVLVVDTGSTAGGVQLVWANRALYDLLGYNNDAEAEPLAPSKHYPDDTAEELRRLLPALQDGEKAHGRSTFLRRDGSTFRADWSITPLHDAKGELRWWMVTGRDASEQEQIDALLAEQRTLRRDSHGMARLADMVAGVAHDFNNALTVIQNLTAMALEDLGAESPSADDLAAVIEAATDASDLARSLTAFGRRGAGSTGRTEPFDFDRIVEQIISVLRRALPKRIDVETDLACGMLVESSESMLQQVLYNLLVNAGAAISGQGRIVVRTRATEDERGRSMAELQVIDDGSGMSPEVRQRIFEPYFTTKGNDGSGLGLPTVLNLVEQHRGVIGIDSTPDEGTTITVMLPVAATRSEQTERTQRQALIIDDDSMILTLLKRLLDRYGFASQTAVSGATAMALSLAEAPDLIIVDLALGRDNGVEVALRLRSRYPNAALVLTTGGVLPDRATPPFPFTHVLRKPFTSGDVGRMLQDLKRD